MSVSHFIVHHLCSGSEADVVLKLGQEDHQAATVSQELADELKHAYLGRISREHGKFSTEGAASPLVSGLEGYLAEDQGFVEFTQQLMAQLKIALEGQGQELDAHAIFFVERSFDNRFFYLFLASHKVSYAIGDDLAVQANHFLDLGPSLYGIKVDLTEWKKDQNYAYLSLIAPRGNKALSEIFYQLTGFSDGVDKEGSTRAFLEGVEAFSKQLPEDQVHEYRNQVVEYCMEQDGRDAPVDFHGLSEAVDGVDTDEFVRFMADHYPGSENEVMMDRRSLRSYVKFAGREKDLAISFSSHQLNNRVHYNPDNDTLSINGIPKALRNQLLGHMRGS